MSSKGMYMLLYTHCQCAQKYRQSITLKVAFLLDKICSRLAATLQLMIGTILFMQTHAADMCWTDVAQRLACPRLLCRHCMLPLHLSNQCNALAVAYASHACPHRGSLKIGMVYSCHSMCTM